jgi:hypothetical protein
MFRFNRKPDISVKDSNLRIWVEQDRIMAVSPSRKQILELRISDGGILEYKRVTSKSWSCYPTINSKQIIDEIIEFQLLGEVHENNSV